MNNSDECYLSEIYSAIQGEGPLVGHRQIFVRFSACDLRCAWCDTPKSLVRTQFCEAEISTGTRKYQKLENPITSLKLIDLVDNLNPEYHQSISLTGGEPLLQWQFIASFLPLLKEKFSLPVYLESGGHRPSELKNVINSLDYISMDFKLPSSAKTEELWDEHIKFLRISLNANKKVWVKIVITFDTDFNELLKSVNIVKSLSSNDKNVEIFLQPASPMNGFLPPDELNLLLIQSSLLKIYPYIRVLPQVHKLIGQK